MKTNHAIRFPPKKILVPLDLSDASIVAWNQAKALALRFGAKVEGLYVQPWLYSELSLYSGMAMPEPATTAQATHKALGELRSKLGAQAVVSAVPGAAIVSTILSWGKDYDLIVMGTHGRTGFDRIVQRSIAEDIMRHASIPVLVTRGQAVDFQSVLAPVNFEPYAMAGLRAAGDIAQAFGVRLTVFHAVDSPLYGGIDNVKGPKGLLRDAIDKLPEEVRKICRPQARLSFGKPAEEIISAAEDGGLIVMVAHRKGFLNDILLGTTVERVLRHSTRPVLAIPSGPAMQRIKRQASAAARHKEVAVAR